MVKKATASRSKKVLSARKTSSTHPNLTRLRSGAVKAAAEGKRQYALGPDLSIAECIEFGKQE